jgi:hypothetical protein
MILSLFYIILVMFCYYKFRNNVLYIFPAINIVWRSLAGFLYPYVSGQYNQDLIITVFLEIFVVIFFSIKLILKRRSQINSIGYLILFYIAYIFLLLGRTSDIWFSFKRILGISSYLLLFLAVFLYTSNRYQIGLLVKSSLLFVIGFELLITVSTILKLGFIQTDGQLIRLTGYTFFDIGGFVFTLSLFPIFFEWFKRKKWMLLIIYLLGFVSIILTTKRAWVVIISFNLVYYIFSRLINNGRIRKSVTYFLIILLVSFLIISPTLINIFKERLPNRLEHIISSSEKIEINGRYLEYSSYYFVLRHSSDPLTFFLFGTEIFNSQGKYPFEFEPDNDRIIHADYAAFLYGTGFLGIIVYLSIFYKIYQKNKYYNKILGKIPNNSHLELLLIVSAFLIITLFFHGFSEGYLNPITRILPFLFIGTLMGYFRTIINQLNNEIRF